MDNIEKSMSGEQELIDIEEKKEQFEYEMTQVLLMFKNEAEALKAKDVSEYLEMEVGKAEVSFEAPEIEVKGVKAAKIAEVKEIAPSENVFEVSVSGIEVPEVKKAEQVIFVEFVASVNTYVPKVPVFSGISGVKADAPEKAVNIAEVPDVNVKVPENIAYEVSIPETAKYEENIPSYTSKAIEAFEVGKVSAAVPEIEKFTVSDDLKVTGTVSVSISENMPETAINSDSFVLGEVKAEKFSVSVTDTAMPAITVLPVPQKAEIPKYPEIPPKPDFSSYYNDIIEALKGEL